MRRIIHLVYALPETCSHLTQHELMVLAVLVMLLITVILLRAGRTAA